MNRDPDITEKPSCQELERRVHELEKNESERNQGEGIVPDGQYRWLVENANELILVAQDGLIRFLNQKVFEYLGYSPEELKDRPLIKYMCPEDRVKVSERHSKRLKGEDLPGVYPFRVVDRDGKVRWMESNAVRSEWNGKPTTFNYINDITERKLMKEEFRQSEETFRTLVNTAPFGIQLTNLEGRIVYSNPAHHTMLGYGPHELIGMYIWDRMANEGHRVKVREYYQTIISKKNAPTVYFSRARTRDGREIDIRINWDYIHNEKDEVTGIISIIENITEREQGEESLHESEEKYRLLFNTFPLGITVSDPSGNIVESNARAAELLGIPKDEHETRCIDGEQWRIIRPDGTLMPAAEWASVRALQENRLIENTEMGIAKPGGKITWINVTAAPLLLDNYGVVITYHDITERKSVEQAIRESEDWFRAIVEGAPDAVFVQTESKFAYLNSQGNGGSFA